MPANKNALLRYKTIDNCLRNRYRRWTLQDLVDACSDALYEYTGKDEYVSVRTVQLDIQKMRSDELGYNAPIVVRDKKYYTYEDADYSITNTPITDGDLRQLREAVLLLKNMSVFKAFSGIEDVVGRLEDHVRAVRHTHRRAIWFEANDGLKGLSFITPLYEAIVAESPIMLTYRSFKSDRDRIFVFSPYILKEYRNRWFVFGRSKNDRYIMNLALDRIVSVEAAEGEVFIKDAEFDPDRYFGDMIGVTKIPRISDRETIVSFWVVAEHVPYIETKPLHQSQMQVKRLEDGSAVFQIKVCQNFELEKILLEYGDFIRVLGPKKLVKTIKKRLRNALARYEGVCLY